MPVSSAPEGRSRDMPLFLLVIKYVSPLMRSVPLSFTELLAAPMVSGDITSSASALV